ncbi:MAG: S-layer homology domain-containing protein [Oscillospiraceae bacterium]|nr:S-layer homology domain-containing protein [Oscillospiraceae bacterium]
MKKRLLSVIAAILLTFSVLSAALAANFADVTDKETKRAVDLLYSLGVVSAAEKFNPDQPLTRAMFCAVAVQLQGITDVDQYKTYTLFPDVRSNHWAMGYVNAAVDLKLFAPLPDGTFAPDRAITYNEAVTILVKMLKYTEADVGYNWPKNYTLKAQSIGLTAGVAASENLTRGQGMKLFYNLLYSPVKDSVGADGATDGGTFIEKVFGLKQVSDAIITEINVYSGGRLGLRTADGTFYPTLKETDASMLDRRVELLRNRHGSVLGIEPHEQKFETITVQSAREGFILDTWDKEIDVPSLTQIIGYGESNLYSNVWESISRRDTLKAAYLPNGALDYLVWQRGDTTHINNVIIMNLNAVDDEGFSGIYVDRGGDARFYPTRVRLDAEVLGRRVDLSLNNRGEVVKVDTLSQSITSTSVDTVTAAGVTGSGGSVLIPGDTAVYMNGGKTTFSSVRNDIERGDTLRAVYKRNGELDYVVWTKSGGDTNLVYLPIFYRSIYHETGTVSISGNSFTLSPEATLQAASFKTGDRVTLVLTSTGQVRAVNGGFSGGAFGILTANDTVILSNGLEVNIKPPEFTLYGWRVAVFGNWEFELVIE